MLHPLLARLVFFFSQTPQTPFASNAFCLKASSRPASSSAPCLLSFSLRPLSLSCWPLVADHICTPTHVRFSPVVHVSRRTRTHEGGVIPVSDESPARPLIPEFLSPHLVSLFLSPPSCSFGVVVGRRRQPATHTPLSVTRGVVWSPFFPASSSPVPASSPAPAPSPVPASSPRPLPRLLRRRPLVSKT